MAPSDQDFNLAAYTYTLPPERIAQAPLARRDASRLMVLDRTSGVTESRHIADLAAILSPGLIVVNNTRVLPARIMGSRHSGGKVECLLLTPLPVMEIAEEDRTDGTGGIYRADADCLLRSSKQVKAGEEVAFGPDLRLILLERGEFGHCRVRLFWNGTDETGETVSTGGGREAGRGALAGILADLGSLPLPPYIRRNADADDATRYQTLFARAEKNGSVAAPTAGLHFTPELRESLTRAGHNWAEVTLYVGYGTFSPVRVEDIRTHAMHSEYIEISAESAAAVNAAKAAGRPVTAIGTTALRTLEGVYAALGHIAPYSGWTDIFLYPGRELHVVDRLLTNFHLPGSTLLMLVAALAGREATLRAYERAVREEYRFFSYGDAMLVK